MQRLDGIVGWALSRAVPLLDANGNITEWFGAASDITARKNAEEALQVLTTHLEERVAVRTRERNRLWELSWDPFMISHLQGRWVSINPVWTQVLGWSREELIRRTSEWMKHPEDRQKTRDEVDNLASGSTTLHFSNRLRTKDDRYRWFSWTAIAENGFLYWVAHDITEERASEESRGQLEELALILGQHHEEKFTSYVLRTFDWKNAESSNSTVYSMHQPRRRALTTHYSVSR